MSTVFSPARIVARNRSSHAARRGPAGTVSRNGINSFASAADGSRFAVELYDLEEPETRKAVGQKASVAFLAREMIVRSSNLAANVLLTKVGVEPVRKLLAAIGAPSVEVRRLVEDVRAFEKGMSNETDARGMGALMEACVRSRLLSEKARSLAFDLLAAQTFNEQVPAGIPRQAGVVVAHKTGSITSVRHDAAILRFPDGRDVVLVLLAGGFEDGEEGRARVVSATRKMARAVWDAVIAP
jgi:beta-lactamase class A